MRAHEREPCALKASVIQPRSALKYEYDTMLQAADAGAPVARVIKDSLTFYTTSDGAYGGGGFLLRDVCKSAECTSVKRCVAAFASLHALHAASFVHGDARLPNLLLRSPRSGVEELVWADLRLAAADPEPADAQRLDARMLAASLLRGWGKLGDEEPLPVDVTAAARRIPEGGASAYAALARAVWDCS